ncbi:hypothetical protein COLO4_24740 [Corchorus olitorius]|uniref:Uncharacterized protein n=1 Tax=Corchorus olitorius TaxID=93759 RepID=A0A1R3I7A9_9ROSI|nr:hypothetical protein COLO4_24740 [Corchorus olitorius]
MVSKAVSSKTVKHIQSKRAESLGEVCFWPVENKIQDQFLNLTYAHKALNMHKQGNQVEHSKQFMQKQ